MTLPHGLFQHGEAIFHPFTGETPLLTYDGRVVHHPGGGEGVQMTEEALSELLQTKAWVLVSHALDSRYLWDRIIPRLTMETHYNTARELCALLAASRIGEADRRDLLREIALRTGCFIGPPYNHGRQARAALEVDYVEMPWRILERPEQRIAA